MAERGPTLLDEVREANREFLADRPVPRPAGLGDRKLLVLTCMDSRLTLLLPKAMGVASEEMIQVRTAGNRAGGGEGDPTRSLVAAIVTLRAAEVFVVGHTDCVMGKASAMSLLNGMEAAGLDREALGRADVREWFGAFASERTNALESARILRKSPYLPPGTPVHALLVDTATGKLDVVDAGYDEAQARSREGPKTVAAPSPPPPFRPPPPPPRTPPMALEPIPLAPSPPEAVPVLPSAPEAVPVISPVPEVEPVADPPPLPRPEPERGKGPSPFERAEDVLARLRKRRRRPKSR